MLLTSDNSVWEGPARTSAHHDHQETLSMTSLDFMQDLVHPMCSTANQCPVSVSQCPESDSRCLMTVSQCPVSVSQCHSVTQDNPCVTHTGYWSEGGDSLASSSSSPASANNDPQYPIDIKYGFDELCPVCGDKVSGYHYGLLTCESCKGFFKRTVQNKKVYSCVDNRNCHIDKSQRKRCPYCRFQKCLQVGMKLEAVRSDRMRGGRNKFGPMYKRDRALKQQAIRQQQQLLASCQMRLSNGMTPVPMAIEDVKPNAALLMGNSSLDFTLTPSPPPPHSLPSAMTPPSPDAHLLAYHTAVTTGSSPTQGMYSFPHHHYTTCSGGGSGMMSPTTTHSPSGMLTVATLPHLIKEMQASMVDEGQVQHKMAAFIQQEFDELHLTQQPESLIRILCQLSDQCLFLMVEWARNSIFFKELKVEDQMKLLQHCWSELILLDFIYRQVKENWQDEFVLASGHHIACDYFDKIGLGDVRERLLELIKKMRDLKIDYNEYICLKFLILLNPDVSGVDGRGFVEQCQEKVNASLLEYCMNFHPMMKDKFGQVLLRLPEIRLVSIRMEEYLYFKHMNGELPEQTLLMEMLHSKRK